MAKAFCFIYKEHVVLAAYLSAPFWVSNSFFSIIADSNDVFKKTCFFGREKDNNSPKASSMDFSGPSMIHCSLRNVVP